MLDCEAVVHEADSEGSGASEIVVNTGSNQLQASRMHFYDYQILDKPKCSQ